MRRSIYQNAIAPSEVQHHLLLNAAKYSTAEDVRNAIEEFCEAKEEADATKTGMNLIGAVGTDAKKRRTGDPVGGNLGQSPDGKGKGDKGGKGDPKGKGKGKGKDKGKGKGDRKH